MSAVVTAFLNSFLIPIGIPIGTALFSGALTIFSAFIPRLWLGNKYETMLRSLKGMGYYDKRPLVLHGRTHKYERLDPEWVNICHWLSDSEILVSSIQHKAIKRFCIVVAIVIGELAALYNLPGIFQTLGNYINLPKDTQLMAIIYCMITCATPAFGVTKVWIFDNDEKQFLRNFDAIYDKFYEEKVTPAIIRMNHYVLATMPGARRSWDEKVKQIIDSVRYGISHYYSISQIFKLIERSATK